MIRKAITIITFLILSATNGVYAGSIISGTGVLDEFWGWDFSEQSCTSDNRDMIVGFIVDPPLGLSVGPTYPPSLIAMLPDSSFEDLKYAPADSSLYKIVQPAYLNVTYVARTLENHYAKFKFISLPYDIPIIEYVYQPDGSRKLFEETGTTKSSWGSIKQIYTK